MSDISLSEFLKGLKSDTVNKSPKIKQKSSDLRNKTINFQDDLIVEPRTYKNETNSLSSSTVKSKSSKNKRSINELKTTNSNDKT